MFVVEHLLFCKKHLHLENKWFSTETFVLLTLSWCNNWRHNLTSCRRCWSTPWWIHQLFLTCLQNKTSHSDICISARKIAAYSFYIDGEVFVKELGGATLVLDNQLLSIHTFLAPGTLVNDNQCCWHSFKFFNYSHSSINFNFCFPSTDSSQVVPNIWNE